MTTAVIPWLFAIRAAANQTVTGIVVAVGLSLWPTEKRGEFGYTRCPVVTSLDLEIILQQSPKHWSGTAGGFRPVCWFTRFCPGFPTVLGYAVLCTPLANLLQSSHTGSEVDIFYLIASTMRVSIRLPRLPAATSELCLER